jgi:GTP pyrophosphokinase
VSGYITRGRGVTVHQMIVPISSITKRASRIVTSQPSGRAMSERSYQALIAIESKDRLGLLHDVTSVLSERRINIHAVNSYPLKDSRARLNIAVTITNTEHSIL